MGIGRRFLLIATLILGLVSVAQRAQAATESITSAKTDINIDMEGIGSFTESINYFFDASKHGIYRDIPVVTQLPDKKYLHYDFDLKSVKRAGSAEPHVLTTIGSMQRIKIGDANKTVAGSQLYELKYTLAPLVRHDSAGDYITLNVIGNQWDVPIQQAQAIVTLPVDTTVKEVICYTGAQGSIDKNCSVSTNANVIKAESIASLSAQQGMTLDIVTAEGSFDTGAYIEPTSQGPTTADNSAASTVMGVVISIFVVIVALVVPIILTVKYLMFKKQQKYHRQLQTVVAQYEPPDGLLPGEVGLLTDDAAGIPEITATIIHLATRGHLKITYEKKTGFLQSGDTFRFTRLETADKLETFETELLHAIFGSRSEVAMADLNPHEMSPAVTKAQAEIKDRLQAKGYYAVKQKLWSAHNVTDEGYKEWAKVEGFKLYLDVAEKDRINFHEAPEKTPEHFSKLLPYAIALGVEKQWAAHFADMDISRATTWYAGDSRALTAVGFTNIISSSFASSMNTNFSPPASSGGSGGGFSGGGGGGGGGGSW